MMLASQFTPIRGIWASFCASAGGTQRGAIDKCAVPIDLVGRLEFREQTFEDLLPDARFLPLPKMAPAGLSTGKIAGGRKPAPGNACPENEEDARKQPARFSRLSSRELHMPAL